ncbi:TPA: SIR2 family protein [Vibrio cholerae]|uniref:SIR2 family NAD-dependent protein deacylase n=1 Tax=Vibrio cidicii TaxID=1763883 RepID=UPI0028DA7D34|nr:SIR2 family protein [Vibrio cholerae]
MRFTVNGPSIPDDLLLARDQGRVIFFCGAGVSRAKAGFADFFGLASSVTAKLGVQTNSAASKLINVAQEITDSTGVEGVVSADKIFGLLEREFLTRDIYEAVAEALTPQSDVDLSAHRTMLKLATTTDGVVRLVTTNFDRLFDICNPQLPTFTPPKLPDLLHPNEFDGVVYLHGKVNESGTGAENSGFVLSSSEFGEAYLANGWATSFVKSILEKYVVVFVGYSADDPPIQYLLEALNKSSNTLNDIYAFQIGSQSEASAKWAHKGVKAIPFDRFDAMWKTLEMWSERAENPTQWYQSVIEKAQLGPQRMQAFERGQVAHIVSHVEGMKKLLEADTLLPASWLHVFDPKLRYKKPKDAVDPFDLYSLDSDPIPQCIEPNDFYTKREVPINAWNAFAISSHDLKQTTESHLDSFFGVTQRSTLPPRLNFLASWLGKVAEQPEAIWWAVQQPNLHPWVKKILKSDLTFGPRNINPVIYSAWLYLLDFFDSNKDKRSYSDWFDLKREVDKTGWTNRVLGNFFKCSQPYISLSLPYTTRSSLVTDELCLEDLIRREVVYPDLPREITVPEEWLYQVTRAIRRNLETAVELELEVGSHCFAMDASIVREDDNEDRYSRTHGLFSWVLLYIKYLEKLARSSISVAQKEMSFWPIDDTTVFAKLRMWALGKNDLVPNNNFHLVFCMIPDDAFWKSSYQRDLLLSIENRWKDLESKTRQCIEERILLGPPRWENEPEEQYKERKARLILDRAVWLSQQGCALEVDLQGLIDKLTQDTPMWDSSFAKDAARSYGARGGIVTTDEDFSSLIGIPLEEVLVKSREMSGRQFDFLVESDPFLGLSRDKPVRAFSALKRSLNAGEIPEWAWDKFLCVDSRKNDKPKLMALIASTLSQFSSEQIAEVMRPICYWLRQSSKVLAENYYDIFVGLVRKTISSIKQHPSKSISSIVRGSDSPDWAMESINSPIGYLLEAIFHDPHIANREEGKGLPENWLCLIEELLGLPNDLRRYALVLLARKLSWFFWVDSNWTRVHLLSALESQEEDYDALWAGVLWEGVTGKELFSILKPYLLKLSYSGNFERHRNLESVVGLVFSAWKLIDDESSERWVSDLELRDVLIKTDDTFRCQFLWRARHGDDIEWLPDFEKLLINVWPKHLVAKSSEVSSRLCEIAFWSESDFVKVAQLILPLLTKFDRNHHLHIHGNDLAKEHPAEFLSILDAVLPDDINIWPYGVGDYIEELSETNAELRKDERLIELRRKWDSR